MPKVGDKAPEFSLKSGEGTPVSLKDYKGKWVVLYFYPRNFTGGCTVEAHNFQRDLDKYTAANAVILGVALTRRPKARFHRRHSASRKACTSRLYPMSLTQVSQTYGSLTTSTKDLQSSMLRATRSSSTQAGRS